MSSYRPSNLETNAIAVRVNGEERNVAPSTTVSALLADLGLEEDRVAVELDREIVSRPLWGSTTLAPGSSIEVVHFVGGG